MTLNLLEDSWLPVTESSTDEPRRVEPLEALTNPEIGGFRAPVASFEAAAAEFLVGLVQTASPPATHEEWRELLVAGPEGRRGRLEEGLRELPHEAFDLGGEGTRYMQADRSVGGGSYKTIGALLMDLPGVNSLSTKNQVYSVPPCCEDLAEYEPCEHILFCDSCTALVLHCFQVYACPEGPSSQVSVRGGCALTSLVSAPSLGDTIWWNVLGEESFRRNWEPRPQDFAGVFPWRGTIESGEEVAANPEDVDLLQFFWPLPRFYRLSDEYRDTGQCTLCGRDGKGWGAIESMGDSSKGLDYTDAWNALRHPLTPYRTGENESALKGKELSCQYDDWRGVAVGDESRSREVARTVARFREEAKMQGVAGSGHLDYFPTLQVFGFNNDRASVYVWNENEFPLEVFQREHAATLIKELLAAAQEAQDDLFQAVRRFSSEVYNPAEGEWQSTGLDYDRSNRDEGVFEDVEARFLAETEPGFRRACSRLSGGAPTDEVAEDWADELEEQALGVFDRLVSMEQRGTDREAIVARQALSRFVRSNAREEMRRLTEEEL